MRRFFLDYELPVIINGISVIRAFRFKKHTYFVARCPDCTLPWTTQAQHIIDKVSKRCPVCSGYKIELPATINGVYIFEAVGREKNGCRLVRAQCPTCGDKEWRPRLSSIKAGTSNQCNKCAAETRIGLTETRILDDWAQRTNSTIIRQHSVVGYFCDGYDKERNIAYEINESAHLKTAAVDYLRRERIRRELNCHFVIIWDFSH